MGQREEAELSALYVLLGLRKNIENLNLQEDNLPRWINNTSIRIGNLNESTIIFFERGRTNNFEVLEYRDVKSDTEFFLPNKRSKHKSVSIDIEQDKEEEIGCSSVANLSIVINKDKCVTNAGFVSNHICLLLYNVMIQFKEKGDVSAMRYVPFALLVPDERLDPAEIWEVCKERIFFTIKSMHESGFHDYRTGPPGKKGLMANVEDTVIVLGNYDSPYKNDLVQVRDSLRYLGYDSFLIENLPQLKEQSLSEKVRLWTTSSRFCVMIDEEASGHIKEYEIVKNNRKPLILLRPKDNGSTWMIGDEDLVDLNHIKTFRFTESPLEKVEDGVRWAEDLLNKRGEAYPEFYPWKDG